MIIFWEITQVEGPDDVAQLSVLQILVEIGFIENPEARIECALLEIFLPKQIAITRAKREWEIDMSSRYCMMEHMSKGDARQQFLRILRILPYRNSVFFNVRKIDDPIGLLAGRIILGINKRGCVALFQMIFLIWLISRVQTSQLTERTEYISGFTFFAQFLKEYLHSAELRDVMQFGSSNTAVFFKMRVAGVLHTFQFETKQVEEICVALQMHINDVMLRRYAKACHAANGSVKGEFTLSVKPPNLVAYEKHVQELSKTYEGAKRNVARVYMVELYQDTLVDLLLPRNARRLNLEIEKDMKGMVFIGNASVVSISNFEELKAIIMRGSERHTVGTHK